MNITAVSDIHAAYGMLDRILEKERSSDVLVIAGDITTHGSPDEFAAALNRIGTARKNIYAVAGNMDVPASESELERLGVSLNARGIRIGDIGFFGVSAAPISMLRTPYELTEEEIEARLCSGYAMIENAPVRICVPHSPPYNTTLDRLHIGAHVGSTAVRTFIETHHPDVVICGHIHEARGQDTLGITRMVNCGPAYKGYYVHITIENTITIENRELKTK